MLQILAIFGVVCGGLYYTRQSVVTNSIMVVKGTNTPVQVSSSDFYVDSSGTLRVRQPAASGRHLLQSSAPTALLTSSGDYYFDANGQMQLSQMRSAEQTNSSRRRLLTSFSLNPFPRSRLGFAAPIVRVNPFSGLPVPTSAATPDPVCAFASAEFKLQTSSYSADCTLAGRMSPTNPTSLTVPITPLTGAAPGIETAMSMAVSSVLYSQASTSPMCPDGQLYTYSLTASVDSHISVCIDKSLTNDTSTTNVPNFGVNAYIDYSYYSPSSLYNPPCTPVPPPVYAVDGVTMLPNGTNNAGICIYPPSFNYTAFTVVDGKTIFNPNAPSGINAASRRLLGCASSCCNPGCCCAPSCTTCSSDERLKTKLTWTGRMVGQLREFTWEWNELAKLLQLHDQPTVGVIAQEAALAYPEAVSTGADGYLRVNYDLLRKMTA